MAGLSPAERSRSPRFPSHSVSEAIDYAGKIYQGVHRSPIDAMTAYKLMGFSGKSGTSATALGSVRQYGLIEGVGDRTRISELGLRVLEPEGLEEKQRAIAEAAKSPTVFRQIFERFDGRLPHADDPIRAFLIRELGFSKSGAEDCLSAVRATAEALSEPSIAHQTAGPTISPPEARMEVHSQAGPSEERGGNLMRIPLTRECTAELRFVGELSEKALSNLVRHIDLMKEMWAE
jgi:hypothetical protein